ncbi:hypothetical protein IFM89_008451 [Coptis chinensis]|uniref:Uncharacterized protein n=1 Tax=Coptis chinensis TaxID=261450 RepID=A0A835IB12_9MAGN|nr:hypothetical protein IFM89_008451 [Coptis chinensis]
MGASNARMGKSDDIESYGNSQNVTHKVGRCKGKNISGRSLPTITVELKVSFPVQSNPVEGLCGTAGISYASFSMELK